MSALQNGLDKILNNFRSSGWNDWVDILIVAVAVYALIGLVRRTRAGQLARGATLILAVYALAFYFNLRTLTWILNNVLQVGFLALVVVFQPELRRALERVGAQLHFHLLSSESGATTEQSAISATVQACEIMSRERVGVLLVFERETPLDDYFKTGTIVDAQLSEQLLRNLFFKNSPLHDGAVIVRGGRVAAAGCVMPLSDNPHLPSDLGTRHRAGVGTSEVSDAVVVIVSEENGTISVAIGGMLKRHLAPQTLQKLLSNELIADETENKTLLKRLAACFSRKDGSK